MNAQMLARSLAHVRSRPGQQLHQYFGKYVRGEVFQRLRNFLVRIEAFLEGVKVVADALHAPPLQARELVHVSTTGLADEEGRLHRHELRRCRHVDVREALFRGELPKYFGRHDRLVFGGADAGRLAPVPRLGDDQLVRVLFRLLGPRIDQLLAADRENFGHELRRDHRRELGFDGDHLPDLGLADRQQLVGPEFCGGRQELGQVFQREVLHVEFADRLLQGLDLQALGDLEDVARAVGGHSLFGLVGKVHKIQDHRHGASLRFGRQLQSGYYRVLFGSAAGTIFLAGVDEQLLELDFHVLAGVEQLFELDIHDVSEQKIALSVSEPHNVSVKVIHIDASLPADRIAV